MDDDDDDYYYYNNNKKKKKKKNKNKNKTHSGKHFVAPVGGFKLKMTQKKRRV